MFGLFGIFAQYSERKGRLFPIFCARLFMENLDQTLNCFFRGYAAMTQGADCLLPNGCNAVFKVVKQSLNILLVSDIKHGGQEQVSQFRQVDGGHICID